MTFSKQKELFAFASLTVKSRKLIILHTSIIKPKRTQMSVAYYTLSKERFY